MTHTERVHVMFGAGLALMGLLAIRAERRPGGAAATAWPILAFLIGLLLFIPVEAQTRTYATLGWADVLRTLLPDDPAHWVRDWLVKARAAHVIQHKSGAVAAMVGGAMELAVARGWVRGPGWRYVLPACLVAVGAAFGIHGGNSHHLPFHMEQLQHHLMGAGLALAGVCVGLQRGGALRHRAWALVWPVLALLAGLNIALFYRLPPGAAAHLNHAAAGAVPHDAGGER
jgi:hypothetical protein